MSSDSAERLRLMDEVRRLRAEVRELRAELQQLRSSKWFRFREKLVPHGSLLQRTYLALRTGAGLRSVRSGNLDYARWCKDRDTLSDADRKTIAADVASMAAAPVISIVMPVYNPPERLLAEAVESVRRQLYPHWQLCIVDDASTDGRIPPLLERLAREDKRIEVRYREKNGHISAATNDGLSMVTGAYVGFLDQDDVLAEHALYTVVKYLEKHPSASFLYSDEDTADVKGKRLDHHFKPDWDPYLLLAGNYTCHLSIFRSDLARETGFRIGFEGAQDWDFTLRYAEQIDASQIVHIPHVLYHWRAHQGSTAQDLNAKPYVSASQTRTVEEALQRRHELASTQRIDNWGIVRCYFEMPGPPPLVSVIIPTRNREELLAKCISSLFSITEYPNYEVILVDNGSDEKPSLELLDQLATDPRVRVLRVEAPFNFSALNNLAAREAKGEVLALLNNDIEIVESSWMYRLTALALRPDVGVVGPRLLYPDRRVQHGGIIVGHGGVAGHGHLGIKESEPGYGGWAVLDRTISAVTGACLFIRKELYEQVKGLDEELAVSFNDVDLCLKVDALGLRNIYAGSVTCLHHESASRGVNDTQPKRLAFEAEVMLFKSRWREKIACDPFYNPNLTLDREAFTPADQPRAALPWRSPKPAADCGK